MEDLIPDIVQVVDVHRGIVIDVAGPQERADGERARADAGVAERRLHAAATHIVVRVRRVAADAGQRGLSAAEATG